MGPHPLAASVERTKKNYLKYLLFFSGVHGFDVRSFVIKKNESNLDKYKL